MRFSLVVCLQLQLLMLYSGGRRKKIPYINLGEGLKKLLITESIYKIFLSPTLCFTFTFVKEMRAFWWLFIPKEKSSYQKEKKRNYPWDGLILIRIKKTSFFFRKGQTCAHKNSKGLGLGTLFVSFLPGHSSFLSLTFTDSRQQNKKTNTLVPLEQLPRPPQATHQFTNWPLEEVRAKQIKG